MRVKEVIKLNLVIPTDDRPDEQSGYNILTKHPRVFIAVNTVKCRLYWRLNEYLNDTDFSDVFLKGLEYYGGLCKACNCGKLDVIHDLRIAKILSDKQVLDYAKFFPLLVKWYNIKHFVTIGDSTNVVHKQLNKAVNWDELQSLEVHQTATFKQAGRLLDELRGHK